MTKEKKYKGMRINEPIEIQVTKIDIEKGTVSLYPVIDCKLIGCPVIAIPVANQYETDRNPFIFMAMNLASDILGINPFALSASLDRRQPCKGYYFFHLGEYFPLWQEMEKEYIGEYYH